MQYVVRNCLSINIKFHKSTKQQNWIDETLVPFNITSGSLCFMNCFTVYEKVLTFQSMKWIEIDSFH